jgi:hypothetical protein
MWDQKLTYRYIIKFYADYYFFQSAQLNIVGYVRAATSYYFGSGSITTI